MGDFTGFTFGDWHSTDPENGIVTVLRASGGDRYEEELQPEMKDVTAEVPGMDGEYYFGSSYGPKKIDIEIAFDSLTEVQFRELRRVFGTRKQKNLIFDERPYKKYMAKLESPIQLSYVCFDEPKKIPGEERDGVRIISRTPRNLTAAVGEAVVGEATVGTAEERVVIDITREQVTPWEYTYDEEDNIIKERIYKGEGKISFVCYFPFAKSVYKELSTEEEGSDWAISSGILTEDEYEDVDKYMVLSSSTESEEQQEQQESTIKGFKLYNPGDMETGFRLYIPAENGSTILPSITLTYKEDGIHETASLVIKSITLKNNLEMGVLIDTTNCIISGVSQITEDSIITTSGNLYNEYIEAGYFFKIEPSLSKNDRSILEVDGGNNIEIFYDYLYL